DRSGWGTAVPAAPRGVRGRVHRLDGHHDDAVAGHVDRCGRSDDEPGSGGTARRAAGRPARTRARHRRGGLRPRERPDRPGSSRPV
ncbi:MAG: hypothetical protein AVDCRST_MAG66-3227, partial [uncultured Pseudonocardia sp.]